MVITMRCELRSESEGRKLPVIVTTNAIIVICDFLVLRIRAHFAEVPQAEGLVLPIGYYVSTVAFR